ncbi:MAG: hypothetical protein ACXAE3_04815 [Candidatus Kariarchaeaceae archaeon]|jgi:hypothetical protein
MRFLRNATFWLLLILCLAPFSTFAAEEGEGEKEGITITQHNEVCLTPNSPTLTTDFILSSYTISEVNDSLELDFEAEILNATVNGTAAELSSFTFSWEYFTLDNTSRVSETGDHFETTLDVSEEAGVLWSLTATNTADEDIEEICVDAIFKLFIEEEHHSEEEEGSLLGSILVSVIIVIAIPSIVLVAFNKYS